jgi:hypothetical protein
MMTVRLHARCRSLTDLLVQSDARVERCIAARFGSLISRLIVARLLSLLLSVMTD